QREIHGDFSLGAVQGFLPHRRKGRDGVLVADLYAKSGATDGHGGEVVEQQGDSGRDVLGIEVGRVAVLLNMSHRGGDNIHAESPKLVLNGGKPLLGGGQLGDRDHDADVLLEHVPVAGDHRREGRLVSGGVRQMQIQPGRRQYLVQKRLGKRGKEVLFVVEVPIEHRGGLAGSRGDVGQRGAVKATLREQLAGCLFEGRPGLATLRSHDCGRHQCCIRSPARSRALGKSWPTTDFATPAAVMAAGRSMSTSMSLSRSRYTRSSVAILPVAPGANGQPPSPPAEASNRVTPDSTAAYALASPAPRVLWKWPPNGSSPRTGCSCAISERTRPGVVVPIVSAMQNRSTPRSRAAAAMSSTFCGGVGPSNGQSHAVATMTSTVTSL